MGNKKKVQRVIGQVVFILIWVAVAAMCITVTVFSREALSADELEGYYRSMEQETVSRVRTYLDERGYEYSGVMLTRVVEADGSRAYTLTVHHDRIDKMTEEEQIRLGQELEQFFFAADECTLKVHFDTSVKQ